MASSMAFFAGNFPFIFSFFFLCLAFLPTQCTDLDGSHAPTPGEALTVNASFFSSLGKRTDPRLGLAIRGSAPRLEPAVGIAHSDLFYYISGRSHGHEKETLYFSFGSRWTIPLLLFLLRQTHLTRGHWQRPLTFLWLLTGAAATGDSNPDAEPPSVSPPLLQRICEWALATAATPLQASKRVLQSSLQWLVAGDYKNPYTWFSWPLMVMALWLAWQVVHFWWKRFGRANPTIIWLRGTEQRFRGWWRGAWEWMQDEQETVQARPAVVTVEDTRRSHVPSTPATNLAASRLRYVGLTPDPKRNLDFERTESTPNGIQTASYVQNGASIANMPESTPWCELTPAQKQDWDGGGQPRMLQEDDRTRQARLKCLEEAYRGNMDCSRNEEAESLRQLDPKETFHLDNCREIVRAIRVLEAMRQTVMGYMDQHQELTLAHGQWLLLEGTRLITDSKWTQLRERMSQEPGLTWSQVVRESCRLMGVTTRGNWQQLLSHMSRLGGRRALTLMEYFHHFQLAAKASNFMLNDLDQRNGTVLHEYMLRGTKMPGLVTYVQLQFQEQWGKNLDYATLTQSKELVMQFSSLNEKDRLPYIVTEGRGGDQALALQFMYLAEELKPRLADLWPMEVRAGALAHFSNADKQGILENLGATRQLFAVTNVEREGGENANPLRVRESRRERSNGSIPTIVPNAMNTIPIDRRPPMEALTKAGRCFKCNRSFSSCRVGENRKQCTHARAADVRRGLLAWIYCPQIFYPTINGRRVSPMPLLNGAERELVREAINADDALRAEYQDMLAERWPEPPAEAARPPVQARAAPTQPQIMRLFLTSTPMQDEEARMMDDGGVGAELQVGNESAWIAEAVVEHGTRRVKLNALVDPGGSASMITLAVCRALDIQLKPYTGPTLAWGTSNSIAVFGAATVAFKASSMDESVLLQDVVVVARPSAATGTAVLVGRGSDSHSERSGRCGSGDSGVAAEGGHLQVLQWACENGCPWDEWTCAYAAQGRHLEVLKWARANGCPWSAVTCAVAAGGGHLEVLKWARVNGCPE